MNDFALISVSIIGIIGAIITTQLWQMNWFKRENFKIQKSNVMSQNKIKLRKLERDLGLNKDKNVQPVEQKGILDLVKGMDRDKIEGILELLQNNEGSGEEGTGSILDQIPPELIQGFLQGISKKNDKNEGSGENQTIYQS